MKLLFKVIFIFFIFVSSAKSSEVTNWLKDEIDTILRAYQNSSITNPEKFNLIEKTINNNFAGAGIAKFVAGKSWSKASKETKKEYITLFKRHLALSIATMMQGYSNQKYSLTNSNYDQKNKVSLVDMEITSNTGKLLVTWRVKESKGRFYVIDLLVADISLVVTKRSEFNSMLKKVNYELEELNKVLNTQNNSSYSKLIN